MSTQRVRFIMPQIQLSNAKPEASARPKMNATRFISVSDQDSADQNFHAD